MARALALTGLRFGRLLAIERIGSRDGQVLWRCLCDCGSEKVSTANQLRWHLKSCGCLKREAQMKNAFKPGHKTLTAKPYGESSFRRLVLSYKKGAIGRGKRFLLTDDQARELFKGDCYYCGMPPATVMTAKRYNGEYVYNGIDRIDNAGDYTPDNCVSCCTLCNRMKSDMPLDVFLGHLHRITEHRGDYV